VTFFYYNPNIHPEHEYVRRRDELAAFSRHVNSPMIEGGRDSARWHDAVMPYVSMGEGSERCRICYEFRMRRAFETGKAGGYDSIGTVLSVSPHKRSEWILEAGRSLSSEFGIQFVDIDFKKNDGFRKGAAIAREMNMYRQNYCGCEFSLAESEERRARRKAQTADSRL
jgi:predicted adenine nucleotide alpha hydrolase (AANH) superfamily ATPase